MKKFKKLIPALCMLLVSAVMLGTTTFAWFSMNNRVTASGMQVVAKSDNTYLLIGTGDNNTYQKIQALANGTTADLAVTDTEAKVYPSRPAQDTTEVGYLAIDKYNIDGQKVTTAGVAVTTKATAAAATNWFTASALKSDSSAIDGTSAKQLTADSFGNYVIKKTVYLTVAAGANPAKNLSVKATITGKAAGKNFSAVKVLVATETGMAILDSANTTSTAIGSDTALITSTTVVAVDIYIYYDGNDSTVNTNASADLTGATISLAFEVASVPAE